MTKAVTITCLKSKKLPTRQRVASLSTLAPSPSNYKRIRSVSVFKRIAKRKSPSLDDIPSRSLRESAPELETPLCDKLNNSMAPDPWKHVITVQIPKQIHPILSMTSDPYREPLFRLERFIAKEMWKAFSPKLDHRIWKHQRKLRYSLPG